MTASRSGIKRVAESDDKPFRDSFVLAAMGNISVFA